MNPWFLNIFASLGVIGLSYWWYTLAIDSPKTTLGLLGLLGAITFLSKIWFPYAS